jgi:hypothetical protein
MVRSSKVDATHQDMNRYDQLARTGESRCYAGGYESTEPDDSYRRKPMICVKLGTRKEGRYVQSAHIYKREREVFCTQHIESIE